MKKYRIETVHTIGVFNGKYQKAVRLLAKCSDKFDEPVVKKINRRVGDIK
jgi:uncharacterized protein HemY